MAFLHPEQARIVRRTFTGPGRIRGAAGTGKTVVALHRAAHVARTTGGRVLVTTYVRTLPKVLEALMQRLAPDVADRIDFRSVHGFAYDVLTSRRGPIAIEAETADRLFKDLWDREGKDSASRQDRPGARVLAGRDPLRAQGPRSDRLPRVRAVCRGSGASAR